LGAAGLLDETEPFSELNHFTVPVKKPEIENAPAEHSVRRT
jgi:hypothetical protein